MFAVSLVAALVLCCILFPSVWATMACDELLDAHEAGLALVSIRNPVRETGPPACMAKLIMLRHKLNQANSKRRCSVSSSQARQAVFHYNLTPARPPRNSPWRLGRAHGKQSYY
ncbi:hypothetical protein PHLGIDRAFT_113296 [Phlebiopsis gigantea 11061_1 CR5-6]|uniref:Secreted protein n=1 Tax=Phlebiopsis gigantea (strain 11061_1 CR5-6) TaxID=745531 RepID=A0A0C3PX82_PHLG1|nr:hypothetical protein PHLGIDRAFT_113296 [Phlebiopsis gigantea 11061_1 CR5-6]